jgi:hypothetical protein
MGSLDVIRDICWLGFSFSILAFMLILYTRSVIAPALRRFA